MSLMIAALLPGARHYCGDDVALLPARPVLARRAQALIGARRYHQEDITHLPPRAFTLRVARLLRGAANGSGVVMGLVRGAGGGLRRLVRLYDHASGRLVAETWSDTDGAYRFENLVAGNWRGSTQLPRWVKADRYEGSENDRKSVAGTKAKKLIEDGRIDAARYMLDNWLPTYFD